jgi:hypothetical protein
MKSVGIGLIATGVLLVVLVVLLLQAEPNGAPQVVEERPVIVAEESIARLPALVNVHDRITLLLPADWQSSELTEAGLEERLVSTAAATGVAISASTLAPLQRGNSADTVILTMQWGTERADEPAPALTVLAVVRNGLTLERYLDAVQSKLSASGAMLQHSGIDWQLRSDGLPVGVLHYTVPVAGGPELAGYQVVALDSSAKHLVILTFTAAASRFAEVFPTVQQIVQTADFS